LAERGLWERADRELARASAIHPKDTGPWLEGFRIFVEHEQWTRADAAMDKVGTLAPRDWQARLNAWAVFAAKEQWERAAGQLAKAASIRPEAPEILLAAFWYHALRKQWDKADAEYARVIAQHPKVAKLRLFAGVTYLNNQRYQPAVAEYAKAVELEPENATAWNQLGVCHYRLRQFDKGAEDTTRALKLKPQEALFYANRASCYAELKQWKRAIGDYAEAVKLAPRNVDYRRDHALVCLAAGDEASYRKDCADLFHDVQGTVARQTVDVAAFVCTVGRNALPDPQRLVSWLQQWENNNKQNAGYLSRLGYAHCRGGTYGQAVDSIKRAVSLLGKEDDLHGLFLALAYHHLGEYQEARRALNRAVEFIESVPKAPGKEDADKPAPLALWVRLAREALRREVEALLDAPHRREAEEHFQKGEWAKAIPHYDALIRAADGKFWPDLARRGDCYAELGEPKKARDSYASAVALAQAELPYARKLYENHALLCLTLGDAKASGQAAARLAERYGKSDDLNVLYALAVACRHTREGVDRPQVTRWTEKLVTENPASWENQLERVFALFEAGRYPDALRQWDRMKEVRVGYGWAEPYDYFYLSMIQHHLGHARMARQHLALGVEWAERFLQGPLLPPEWGDRPAWPSRVELAFLRRQAEALIGSVPPSAVGKCMRQKDWGEAVLHLDRRLATDPASALDLISRARCQGELGHWLKAAADYAKLAELAPDKPAHWNDLTMAYLAAGELPGYRRACARMLENFDKSQWWHVFYRAVVIPDTFADPAKLSSLAESNNDARAMAAATYRAGRFAEALQQFEASAKTYHQRAWDWLFMAMCHHRLGHAKYAKDFLARATRWIQNADQRPFASDDWLDAWYWWGERIEVQYLRREVETLLATSPAGK
jgi:tetratricopeptide (TPR) repeat protein